MGDGAHRKECFGLAKGFYLIIHKVSAIGFFIGFTAHIQMHWKYIRAIAKQWTKKLPQKTKSRTREQILLLITTIVVLWAGFYPWIAMPGATLEVETYHNWIDVHNRIGIFFFLEWLCTSLGGGGGFFESH
jgi:hypothetical protein